MADLLNQRIPYAALLDCNKFDASKTIKEIDHTLKVSDRRSLPERSVSMGVAVMVQGERGFDKPVRKPIEMTFC